MSLKLFSSLYQLLTIDLLLVDLESKVGCSNTLKAFSLHGYIEHSSLQLPFSVHLLTAMNKESEWVILVSDFGKVAYQLAVRLA